MLFFFLMKQHPPRSTPYLHTLSLHDALPIVLKKDKSDRVDCPSPLELRSGKRVDSKSCDCAFSNCRLPPCSPLAPHRMRLHSRRRTMAIPRAIPPCCPSSTATRATRSAPTCCSSPPNNRGSAHAGASAASTSSTPHDRKNTRLNSSN